MKSAEERLQATGMFHTFAIRSKALMSGSCGNGSKGSQKKMTKSISDSGNFGANLLIAAQGTALELVDRNLQLVLQELSGRAGRIQIVIRQQVAIEVRPFEQITLLVVVCYQGDVFLGRHRQNFMLFQCDDYPSMIVVRTDYVLMNTISAVALANTLAPIPTTLPGRRSSNELLWPYRY